MIKRIAHIGVAVENLKASSDLFTRLLGRSPEQTESVVEQRAMISFYPVGDSSIELIEPMRGPASGSPVENFIKKRGEGIHHVCLEVDDIVFEINRLKGLGFLFVDDHPSQGGDGALVAFIHPKSANGVLVELSQPQR